MAAPVSYKLIVIGSSGVGKTCLLHRLTKGAFDSESAPSVGVKFQAFPLAIDDKRVKLQIWDTVGQERFHAQSKSYYRNAVGVVLVFDITTRATFDDLAAWLGEVHALCDPNAVVQLVGNKCDLAAERAVTALEAEDFARKHQMAYIEASAKGGENVREAFVALATAILGRGLKGLPGPANPRPSAPPPPVGPPPQKCC
jgi:small GTP-binding protein